MMSSRFDSGSILVRPQKPWTSFFYSSMNGLGLKTLVSSMAEQSTQHITTHMQLVPLDHASHNQFHTTYTTPTCQDDQAASPTLSSFSLLTT